MALAAGMVGPSEAWAQCKDNFNIVGFPAIFGTVPVSQLFPLGGGSSISALMSTINTINTAFLTQTTAFVSAPGNPKPNQQGSGAWGRVIGGSVETKTSSVGTLDLVGLNVTGSQTCNTTTKQDYWGYQVGHDISILNGGSTGANWHVGVTAGYLEAKTKEQTPAGSFSNPNLSLVPFNTPAGAFSADSDVPFVGIYTAFTKGGFFLDAQARWDFFQNSLTDPNNGLSGQALNAEGYSLTANVGYNIPLNSGWFIEPSGGVVWSKVKVNPLDVAGTFNPAAAGVGGIISAGRVVVEDIESVLGRATLRVGTNFVSGGVAWQPFFTASVFHEFAGDVTVRALGSALSVFIADGDALTIRSEGGVGTYGQFALGTAAAILNTGWLGYARLDYRVGDEIEGWSVNAGLRYQFSPDQPGGTKDGFASAAPTYNWTGAYIGASAGSVQADQDWARITGERLDNVIAGYLAGGQIGYNLQIGSAVVGVEVDIGATNAHGGVSCPNALFFTCESSAEYLGSVAGRLGFTSGRALFYAKGGWAFGKVAAGTHLNPGANLVGFPAFATPVTTTNSVDGWALGGGMEFALTDRWSAKAEYMRYEFDAERFRVTDAATSLWDIDTSTNVFRIGVNLHMHPLRSEKPLK
jgi:opacity protein-like surface antigen